MNRTPKLAGPTLPRQSLLGVCAVHAAALTLALLVTLNAIGDALPVAGYFRDLNLYFRWSTEMFNGRLPYRDFPIEYPPLALPVFLLPRLLAGRIETYAWTFGFLMILISSGIAALILRVVAAAESTTAALPRVAWYTLCLLILTPLPTTRFDLFPAFLGFLAVLSFANGSPRLSGALAAIGAFIKIFPALFVLPSLVSAIRRRAQLNRHCAQQLISFAAVGLALLSAWLLLSFPGFRNSLHYQASRGLQIESLYASLLMLYYRATGVPIAHHYANAAFDLVSPLSSTFAASSLPLQLAAIAASVFLTTRRSCASHPFRTAAALLLAFIVFSKVLSTQYLIWLLPLIAVLPEKMGSKARTLTLAACALTAAVDPWLWQGLLQFQLLPLALLAARNLTLVALWLVVLFRPCGPSGA